MISLTPEELANLIANAVATGVATALAQAPAPQPSANARRCKEYRQRGGGQVSSDVRMAILERDDHSCQECGSKERLEIDHVIPLAKGGHPTDPDNLQVLCRSCNVRKRDRIRKSDNRGQLRNSAEFHGNSSEELRKIAENCGSAEIQPSPSPLSPTPPIPAPPPAIYASAKGTSNEVEKSNIKPTKRAESAKALAEKEAQLVSDLDLPTQILANPDLLAAWQAWHQWRVRLAITGKVGGKRYPWTVGAAQRAINQITKVTSTIAIQAIYKAIDHGWTGLHFHETQGNHQFARKPNAESPRRTDSLNAPDRYAETSNHGATSQRRSNQANDLDMAFEL